MPYYRCPSCDVTSYSAASYSTVGVCPECNTALGGGSNGLVPPEPALRYMLAAHSASAGEARRAVEALALPEEACETLSLLATELVTNAVMHAGSPADDVPAADAAPIELLLTRNLGDVRVAVRDGGAGFTPAEPPVAQTLGGLGLVIVGALSKDWGIEASGHGCTVWCTLDVPAAA